MLPQFSWLGLCWTGVLLCCRHLLRSVSSPSVAVTTWCGPIFSLTLCTLTHYRHWLDSSLMRPSPSPWMKRWKCWLCCRSYWHISWMQSLCCLLALCSNSEVHVESLSEILLKHLQHPHFPFCVELSLYGLCQLLPLLSHSDVRKVGSLETFLPMYSSCVCMATGPVVLA